VTHWLWNRLVVSMPLVASDERRRGLSSRALAALAEQTEDSVVAVIVPQHRARPDARAALAQIARTVRAALDVGCSGNHLADWILHVEDDVVLAGDFARRAELAVEDMLDRRAPGWFGLTFFSPGRSRPGLNELDAESWEMSQCVLVPRIVAIMWHDLLGDWWELRPDARGGPDVALGTAFHRCGVDLFEVSPSAAQHDPGSSMFGHQVFRSSQTFKDEVDR
jgi:hypothetical protein